MATRRTKPKTAGDTEVLYSAFKEITEVVDKKYTLLSERMVARLDEKEMLEKQVAGLKEELKRIYHELQQYREGTRVQAYKDKLQQSKLEIDSYKRKLEECQKTIQQYETFFKQTELNLQQQLEAISAKEAEYREWERQLQYREAELALHEKPKSKDNEKSMQPSVEKKQIRRRSSSVDRISRSPVKVQYGVIRPGSITHDTIQQNFIEYYTKYKRQRVGSVLMGYDKHHATILTHIVQIAFDKSKDKILELIRQTIENKRKTDDVLKAVSLIRTNCLSTSFKADTEEIKGLLSKPIYTVDYMAKPEGWEEKKHAYSLLLNASVLSELHSNQILAMLQGEVLQNVKENVTNNADIDDLVKKAVHLSWNMVTLVPPAIVAQPTDYHDEWHEKRYSSWTEDASDQMLNYYRPVLFYSTLGHVAYKGEVGNILPANTEASGYQKDPRPSSALQNTKSFIIIPNLTLSPTLFLRSRRPLKAHTCNPCVGDKLAYSYGMKQH